MPLNNLEEPVIAIRLFIGVLSIVCGIASVGLAIPLIRGRIPMNDTYGVRIPKSFTSEENWYKINTFGSKIMIAFFSLPLILFGVVCMFQPFSSVNTLIFAFLSVIIVSSVLCISIIFQFGKKLS
jgi:hypothetical protein